MEKGRVYWEGQEKMPSTGTCSFKGDEMGENKFTAILSGVCISRKHSLTNEIHFLKSRIRVFFFPTLN